MCTLLPVWLQLKALPVQPQPLKFKTKLTALLLVVIVPVFFYYTVDDDWRNNVSSNKYNIEIAGNGPFEFCHAFWNNELDYNTFYLTEANDKALVTLRSLLQQKNTVYTDSNITRRVAPTKAAFSSQPNIVMIVVESLSSDFMGTFGAEKSFTPNIDKLAAQSYIYTDVLATGTRTVRGLEALSLAVPPTAGQSILRRPDFQNMFTLGSVLKHAGYTPEFLYGGYGYFDNMNDFYAENGYEVFDRNNIPKEKITVASVWGVADETLFDCVLQEMDQKTAADKPVFQFIMTTSNHRPYIFPEGRVDSPQGHREGAVRYTDWAINDFIQKAKNKPWFDNTIFVIVADHQASVAGKVELPVHKYRIPLLVYAPKLIVPGVNNRLMSQTDVAPTLLGMLGRPYDSRFMGYDVNALEPGRERAFISTYQSLGYIKGDKLVVLKPERHVETFKILDFKKSTYAPIPNEAALTAEAITWYQGASYLYNSENLKALN